MRARNNIAGALLVLLAGASAASADVRNRSGSISTQSHDTFVAQNEAGARATDAGAAPVVCSNDTLDQLKADAVQAKRRWSQGLGKRSYYLYLAGRNNLWAYAAQCQAQLGLDLTALAAEFDGGARAASRGETQATTDPASRMAAHDHPNFTGGPNTFGYRYADNLTDPSLPYGYINLDGQPAALNMLDDSFANGIPLNGGIGPAFNFYFFTQPGAPAVPFTTVNASSNGFLSFTPLANSFLINECEQSGAAPNNVIAAFWDDVLPLGSGFVDLRTAVLGNVVGQRVFVMQWNGRASNNGAIRAQIQLYEGTNDIVVAFGAAGGNAIPTVGIQDATGTDYLTWASCNTTLVDSGLTILFDYPDYSDLTIDKTGPAAAVAGTNQTYLLTVTNEGPNDASQVEVRDWVPAGMRIIGYLPLTDPTTVCQIVTTTNLNDSLVCQLGDLPVDLDNPPLTNFETIAVQVRVVPGATPGNFVDTAWVYSQNNFFDLGYSGAPVDASTLPAGPPAPGNNYDQVTTAVTASTDLVVTKTASTVTPVAGGTVSFTIDVANDGSSTAATVTLSDVLAPNFTYLWDTAGCGDAALAAGTCALGDIPPNQSRTVTIYAQVPPTVGCDGVAGPFNNTAVAATPTSDVNPANNTATVTLTPQCVSDLRILKFGQPDPNVPAGGLLTYTLMVENLGPSVVAAPQILDQITSSGAITLAVVNPDVEAAFAVPPTCTPDSLAKTVVCTNPATNTLGLLSAGKRWVVTYTVTANEAQSLSNTASVTAASSTDPDLSNNTVSVVADITALTDIALTKVASSPVSGLFVAGEAGDLQYLLTVTNNGPSTADGVELTDLLPAGITLVSVTPSTGSCTPGVPGDPTQPLHCNLGTLAPAAAPTVTVVATIDADVPVGTLLSNSAVASSATYDGTPGNNLATAPVTVGGQYDLIVDKVGIGNPIAGLPGSYTFVISVGNNGPSVAPNVVINDLLPATFAVESVDITTAAGTTQGNCIVVPGALVCPIGDVPPTGNAWAILTIHVEVLSGTAPNTAFINNASAISIDFPAGEQVPADNTDAVNGNTLSEVDLGITKAIDDLTPVAGTQITYTLVASNAGPSDAANVTVTDALPAGLTYLTDSANCGANLATGCDIGTLQPGESRTIEVRALVSATATCGALLSNTATVSVPAVAGLTVINTADDTATVPAYVDCGADLSLTKTGSDADHVLATGDTLTYTITVVNHGPSAATSARVSDTITADAAFTVVAVNADVNGISAGPATCTLGAGPYAGVVNFTCDLNDTFVANGTPWVITVQVQSVVEQTMANSATASSAVPDNDPSNDTAETSDAWVETAGLSLTKTDAPDPVVAGQDITYTLTVTNLSATTAASNALVWDYLPAGVSVVSVTPSAGTCNAGVPGDPLSPTTCELGSIAPAGVATVTIVVRVDADVPNATILFNDAEVTSDAIDPNLSDNLATASTLVQAWVDVGIVKTQATATPFAGGTQTYRLAVTNIGSSYSGTVTITDVLPAILSNPTANVILGGGSCSILAGTLTCTFPSLPPSPSAGAVVIVTGSISMGVAHGTAMNNTATVTSAASDGNGANNSSMVAATVQNQADLAINKTVSSPNVAAGGVVTYTLSVVNNGPAWSGPVTITDSLAFQLQSAAATVVSGGGSCTIVANTVTCTFASLAPMAPVASAVVTISAVVSPAVANGTVIGNTATVSSVTADTNAGNNSANVNFNVVSGSDLAIVKTASTPTPAAGGPLSYTLTVVNNGPGAAGPVTITDTLPARLQSPTATIQLGSGTCTITSGVLSCSFPTLAANAPAASAVVKVTGTVDPTTPNGTVVGNTATVSSTALDPVAGNNSSSVNVTVGNAPDLKVTMVAERQREVAGTEPEWVDQGDSVDYLITVTNVGTGDATNVNVEVVLPLGMTWQQDTASCTFTVVTPPTLVTGDCGLGTLTPGEVVTFTVTARVDQAAVGFLDATAAGSFSPGVDPTPANNMATARIYASYFGDVPIGDFFWPYIQTLREFGITNGCGTRIYCPDNNILRWEMALMIERGLAMPLPYGFAEPLPVGPGTGLFADVPVGSNGAAAIEKMYADGITLGCGVAPLIYCPNRGLYRREMAAFLERVLVNFDGANNPAGDAFVGYFTDVTAATEHSRYIEELFEDNITAGCQAQPRRYCPADYTTRAQMAAFLVRLFGLPLP